jgi:ribosomal protein L29
LSHDIEIDRQYKILRKLEPDELEAQIKALKKLQFQLDAVAARKNYKIKSQEHSRCKLCDFLSRFFRKKGKKTTSSGKR